MTFEKRYTTGDKHGNLMRAWFTAPATTKYKFHAACDDKCILKYGKTPGDSTTNLKELIKIDAAKSYRDYWTEPKKTSSDWVSLTKGMSYYLEGR
jgi:hypothetical protein